jgi:hypothetical protein
MKRRLRVGTISPSKGYYFLTQAAPYPPPSAPISQPLEKKLENAVFTPFRAPESFSAFSDNFKRFNFALSELHSDPSTPKDITLALEVGVDSLNKRFESDSLEVSTLPHARQYLAFLKLSEHYDKLIGGFISCAKRKDLGGMLDVGDVMGLGLSKKLAKKGAISLPDKGLNRVEG